MTFAQWLEQVASARPLSEKVKRRYASLLTLHSANSPILVAAEAAELAQRCPFSALRLLLTIRLGQILRRQAQRRSSSSGASTTRLGRKEALSECLALGEWRKRSQQSLLEAPT